MINHFKAEFYKLRHSKILITILGVCAAVIMVSFALGDMTFFGAGDGTESVIGFQAKCYLSSEIPTFQTVARSSLAYTALSWADSEALLRVRRQIDEGFLEPVTIAELSKQHFMCESKLREIFRKHYGITIYQYMLNRRMEHACELLSVPDAQVKDIAGLVGYSNISHFSDAFRKKFGCTPSEYKRSLPF